jgi:hypothetical protein
MYPKCVQVSRPASWGLPFTNFKLIHKTTTTPRPSTNPVAYSAQFTTTSSTVTVSSSTPVRTSTRGILAQKPSSITLIYCRHPEPISNFGITSGVQLFTYYSTTLTR